MIPVEARFSIHDTQRKKQQADAIVTAQANTHIPVMNLLWCYIVLIFSPF